MSQFATPLEDLHTNGSRVVYQRLYHGIDDHSGADYRGSSSNIVLRAHEHVAAFEAAAAGETVCKRRSMLSHHVNAADCCNAGSDDRLFIIMAHRRLHVVNDCGTDLLSMASGSRCGDGGALAKTMLLASGKPDQFVAGRLSANITPRWSPSRCTVAAMQSSTSPAKCGTHTSPLTSLFPKCRRWIAHACLSLLPAASAVLLWRLSNSCSTAFSTAM